MDDKKKIKKWISRGLNHTEEELNEILKIFHTTTNCKLCNKLLTSVNCGSQKCMDHNHATGKFRQILCKSCNINYDSKKRIMPKRYTEEQLKENQKIANRKCDLKRKNDPKRKEYMKEYLSNYIKTNREKKLKQDREYYKFKCSWGGNKISNCNLLEIDIDIFNYL
jgi:hypothetical protein